MDNGNTKEKPGKKAVHKDLRLYLSWISTNPGALLERFPRLSFAEQLGIVLFTSGILRQELIISSQKGAQLVSSLPEAEVFLTVKEIGLSDAHPFLSLMTSDQLQYVGDLEVWGKDTFRPFRLIEFIEHIHQCGEDKLADWLATVDPELLVLLLKHYGSVTKFDISQDPLESRDAQASSSTNDGYYLFQSVAEEVRPLLESVLRILHVRDPVRHARILESAYQDMITDVEEDALRWRGARLSEKGILGFEEASEIYHYLSDEDFFMQVASVPLPEQSSPSGPVMYPVRWLPKDSFIRNVLREIADDPQVDRIRWEVATVTNKVIIADGRDIGDPGALKEALAKVAGFLTIALSHLAGNNVREAAAWMSRTWIHFLFRLGYSQIYTLVERARHIRPRATFRWIDRTLYLTDSPMEETLRGLLWPHPLFFEGQSNANFLGYREFSSMDDVTITKGRLTSIEFLAEYFDRYLSLPPETIKTSCLEGGMGDRLDHVKWSHVLATVWVRSLIQHSYIFQPLTSKEMEHCIGTVFSTTKTGKRKMIHASKIKAFVKWLDEPIPKDRRAGGDVLHDLFLKARQAVEEELRDLDPTQPVDPRFLQSLCISLAH